MQRRSRHTTRKTPVKEQANELDSPNLKTPALQKTLLRGETGPGRQHLCRAWSWSRPNTQNPDSARENKPPGTDRGKRVKQTLHQRRHRGKAAVKARSASLLIRSLQINPTTQCRCTPSKRPRVEGRATPGAEEAGEESGFSTYPAVPYRVQPSHP